MVVIHAMHFKICFSLSHHSNLQNNLTHGAKKSTSNSLEVSNTTKEEEGPAVITWPEDSFLVQSCLHASLETTCFLQAFPNQRQSSLDNIKQGMLTPGHHGQYNGRWKDGAFQPSRKAMPAPSCTIQADSQAEPNRHWQIRGTGFTGISDLIHYDKPLCSLANLVKRLSLKK